MLLDIQGGIYYGYDSTTQYDIDECELTVRNFQQQFSKIYRKVIFWLQD